MPRKYKLLCNIQTVNNKNTKFPPQATTKQLFDKSREFSMRILITTSFLPFLPSDFFFANCCLSVIGGRVRDASRKQEEEEGGGCVVLGLGHLVSSAPSLKASRLAEGPGCHPTPLITMRAINWAGGAGANAAAIPRRTFNSSPADRRQFEGAIALAIEDASLPPPAETSQAISYSEGGTRQAFVLLLGRFALRPRKRSEGPVVRGD